MSTLSSDEVRQVLTEIANYGHFKQLRDAEKAKKVSEDYGKRLQDTLQKSTDKFINLAEKLLHKKEDEIKQI